jgi:hypothetical protein
MQTGHFDLPAECVAVIDTPEFQRLRELKQLGLTYYVRRRARVLKSGRSGKRLLCLFRQHTPHPPSQTRMRATKKTKKVYPGASHARFEHSLGVAHLAGTWAEHLLGTLRPPGAARTREDRFGVRALELAGLCHDLGALCVCVFWGSGGGGGAAGRGLPCACVAASLLFFEPCLPRKKKHPLPKPRPRAVLARV